VLAADSSARPAIFRGRNATSQAEQPTADCLSPGRRPGLVGFLVPVHPLANTSGECLRAAASRGPVTSCESSPGRIGGTRSSTSYCCPSAWKGSLVARMVATPQSTSPADDSSHAETAVGTTSHACGSARRRAGAPTAHRPRARRRRACCNDPRSGHQGSASQPADSTNSQRQGRTNNQPAQCK